METVPVHFCNSLYTVHQIGSSDQANKTTSMITGLFGFPQISAQDNLHLVKSSNFYVEAEQTQTTNLLNIAVIQY